MAEERIGFGGLDIHLQMGIFVKAAKGKACEAKGEELMSAYRDITINCGLCGSVPLGDGCEIKKDYVTGCKTKN